MKERQKVVWQRENEEEFFRSGADVSPAPEEYIERASRFGA